LRFTRHLDLLQEQQETPAADCWVSQARPVTQAVILLRLGMDQGIAVQRERSEKWNK
jgi:hypothetical protein